MIEEKDVWYYFQKAKGNDIDYPSDKKWENVKKKLVSDNQEKIEELTKYFNTKWSSINIQKYFEIGFKLWKSFSYKHFLRPEIIKNYKVNDKREKRKKTTNKDLLQSINFVINNRSSLSDYGKEKVDNFFLSLPIEDYLQNRINQLILVYMLEKSYLKINNNEKEFVPFIFDRYNQLKKEVREKWEILNKLENKAMSNQYDKDKYLDKPEDNDMNTQEQLLYGDESLEEKERKKKEYQQYQLNE